MKKLLGSGDGQVKQKVVAVANVRRKSWLFEEELTLQTSAVENLLRWAKVPLTVYCW